ncbi:hypothetical protein [Mycobacterium riyadhense]|uniref:hypothetical protein n=1 Tax=Mycobacterium riyadhense TaxID=486698 RepID=UPI0020965133|nr:hypothetical protein [Mycobacterium riyadhense]
MGAQQDPHQLRGSIRAVDRHRVARPDVAVWSFSSQQATLGRLDKAFGGFFRRVKTAKPAVKPGYRWFKGKARFGCVEWPKDGDGVRWLPGTKRV